MTDGIIQPDILAAAAKFLADQQTQLETARAANQTNLQAAQDQMASITAQLAMLQKMVDFYTAQQILHDKLQADLDALAAPAPIIPEPTAVG